MGPQNHPVGTANPTDEQGHPDPTSAFERTGRIRQPDRSKQERRENSDILPLLGLPCEIPDGASSTTVGESVQESDARCRYQSLL